MCEYADKGLSLVQLVVHVVFDPAVEGGGVGVFLQLLPQVGLHAQQREQEAQAAVLQNLHHALLATVSFCTNKNNNRLVSKD